MPSPESTTPETPLVSPAARRLHRAVFVRALARLLYHAALGDTRQADALSELPPLPADADARLRRIAAAALHELDAPVRELALQNVRDQYGDAAVNAVRTYPEALWGAAHQLERSQAQ